VVSITKKQLRKFILMKQGLFGPYKLAGKTGIMEYLNYPPMNWQDSWSIDLPWSKLTQLSGSLGRAANLFATRPRCPCGSFLTRQKKQSFCQDIYTGVFVPVMV